MDGARESLSRGLLQARQQWLRSSRLFKEYLAEASGGRTHLRHKVPHNGFEARAQHRPRMASTAIVAETGRRSLGNEWGEPCSWTSGKAGRSDSGNLPDVPNWRGDTVIHLGTPLGSGNGKYPGDGSESALQKLYAIATLRFPSGQVAQLVERSPEKAGVGGSIPSLATMFSITYSRLEPPKMTESQRD